MNEMQIFEAATVAREVLEPWDQELIHKAWLKYAESDNEFPPNPGQLISLAKEIRREEWDKRQREISQLPEPKTERVPCPPEIMAEMKSLFKPPYEA